MSQQQWFTKQEVIAVTGWSKRTVEWKAQTGELHHRLAETPAANGKREREYDPTSIPESAVNMQALQRVLLAKRLADEAPPTATSALVPTTQPTLLTAPPVDERQTLLPLACPPPGEKVLRRLAVPPELAGRAAARCAAIQPLLDWDMGKRPTFLGADGRPITSKDEFADWLGKGYVDERGQARPVSRATLWNWLRRFRDHGEAGLVNDIRADKGDSRFFQRHAVAAKFVLAKFGEGQGHYSDTLIWSALKREWERLYGDNLKPPSLGTVRNYLKSVPKPLRDAARLPKQIHDQKYAPYVITDIAAVRPNQIWVTDHRIYDVIVVNDCFVGAPEMAAIRLWETAIEDMRTRAIVGSVWNVTPSSRTIASALRQAIATYGMPETLYSDNGKDFRKIGGGWARSPEDLDEEGRIVPAAAAASLLERLGIKVQFCIPRHPKSKQIESYFSTVSKRFDTMFGAGYAGSKPALRTDACREAERLHKLFLQGKRRETPFVLASHFLRLHQQWTLEFNTSHAHSGRGMDGRAPLDVFNTLLPVRTIPDMQQLEPLFHDRVRRIVANCKVELDKWEYEPVDEAGAAAMYLANGSAILIARDPSDLNYAIALREDGSGLNHGQPVVLRAKELVARGPQSADAIAATQRYQKRLYKAGKQFWSLMQAGIPTELDLLAERGDIAAPAVPEISPAKPRHLAAVAGGAPASPVYREDLVDELRAYMPNNEDHNACD